ncbi:DEAD/DEAH box helicase family protein [Endozoicomonas euniceicola]|uniref:DEAD/DEAH box helicase family protein n=2 Tax=Endozoicomonas euniceicola TaxID=1234143 RepID=A0ABY6H156_9GAMM|nr:DEAD/DEAH box helicase family protein [Endozoicomonas euniceicola]
MVRQRGKGYVAGNPADFDRRFAIDKTLFWQFLYTTQPEELAKLKNLPNWEQLVLERLSNKIRKDGVVTILKKGLQINDAHLQLTYKGVYNSLNPHQKTLFEQNIFSVTRQVHYSETEPGKSVDMVLFVNGLALATFELKKPQTKQTVHNAMKQYRETRDPKTTLFRFGQCLVHFAVDTDEVFMTTQVNGKSTYFLPFNKGVNNGKGNPVNPKGYKTAYLWNEVLEPHSLVQILEHFAKMVEEKDKKGKTKKTLFFPRYHQMEVVRKALIHAKQHGAGQRYLIQHSAGSGKSNSITWLAFQLIELYNPTGRENVFDSVIVVTDRKILDQQLRNNIRQFSEVKNIVAAAEKSDELRSHLEQGKRLIITTIQKFPFIVDGIGDLSEKRFAVIIDEAHSSQSGKSADKLNMSLGMEDDHTEDALQDKILKAMEGRKMSDNASYFAFTATPKNSTLEKFGKQSPDDGKFYPFHLYSMRQAIEEDFILDVLKNYTTYQSFYEIQKSVQDNPAFNSKKAQAKLKAYVESHPDTIEKKAAVMVNHFIESVVKGRKLKGKAKAMVVASSIERAYEYYLVISRLLKEANMPFGAIVAFSEKEGFEHTEESVNGFSGKDIPDRFRSDDYRILVVARKYTTGFDEPLLHTMYVDRKLQSVQAVQTLSRLNRCNPKMEKNDTFVLDFANTSTEIKKAFDDFYSSTVLEEATDVNALHDWKDELDNVGVYELHEVEEFNRLFWEHRPDEELHPIADIAAERFDEIGAELGDENEADKLKIDFKIKAKQFTKVYGQLACIMPFNNVQWEMLHWYLLFLIPKLKVKTPENEDLKKLLESIDMNTYAMARVKLNEHIALDDSEAVVAPQNPNQRGYHGEEEKDPLDVIVENFNDRHYAGWDGTPDEMKVKIQTIASHVEKNPDYLNQVANNPDKQNRKLAEEQMIGAAMRAQRKNDMDFYKLFIKDEDFKRSLTDTVSQFLSLNQEKGSQLYGGKSTLLADQPQVSDPSSEGGYTFGVPMGDRTFFFYEDVINNENVSPLASATIRLDKPYEENFASMSFINESQKLRKIGVVSANILTDYFSVISTLQSCLDDNEIPAYFPEEKSEGVFWALKKVYSGSTIFEIVLCLCAAGGMVMKFLEKYPKLSDGFLRLKSDLAKVSQVVEGEKTQITLEPVLEKKIKERKR